MTPDTDDLRTLDRDVGRASAAHRAWKEQLQREPAPRSEDEPLAPWRHVTGKSLYERLGALKPPSAEVPLRDALRRHVYALLQARLGRPLDAELALAEHETVARASIPVARLVNAREARRELLRAATSYERQSWVEVLAQRGPALASVARRRAERRREAASLLGLDAEDVFPIAGAALVPAAVDLLARTEDLAREVLRDGRKRLGMDDDPPRAVDAIALGLARDAPEGWPARLGSPWLDATLGHFARGLRLMPLAVEEPVGAATFARACASFGAALRVAGASPSLPFALARDPQFTAMHRFAFVFGALPASPSFQRRVLGNGARVALDQARVLARSALFQARLEAARYLACRAPTVLPFEELTHRLFGAPLPAPLAGAWPRAFDDVPARLTGLLGAGALASELVERYDEDWFANPRAVQHLRALASGPAWEEAVPGAADPLPPAVAGLARTFEQALG